MPKKKTTLQTKTAKFSRLNNWFKNNKKLAFTGLAVVVVAAGTGTYFLAQSSAATTCKQRTLRQGSSGSCVRLLQRALNQDTTTSRTIIKADGSFGNRTRSRVLQYQRSHLGPRYHTGVVSTQTWNSLCTMLRSPIAPPSHKIPNAQISRGIGC